MDCSILCKSFTETVFLSLSFDSGFGERKALSKHQLRKLPVCQQVNKGLGQFVACPHHLCRSFVWQIIEMSNAFFSSSFYAFPPLPNEPCALMTKSWIGIQETLPLSVFRMHTHINGVPMDLFLNYFSQRICWPRYAVRNKLWKCICSDQAQNDWSAHRRYEDQAKYSEWKRNEMRWMPLFGNDSRWPLMYANCLLCECVCACKSNSTQQAQIYEYHHAY